MLRQCIREHLPAFLAQAAESERGVPGFVRKELEGLLDCGVLERGLAPVVCGQCGLVRLVPFSCKGRGVCPSCIARRMSDTAAHLVERVLPAVPIRQWVLSMPAPLRYLLAWDSGVVAEGVRVFIAAVFQHLRRVGQRELGLAPVASFPGAVCMVQRWGGSVNLNVHLHAMVLDGVFADEEAGEGRPDGAAAVRFHALPAPSRVAVAAVA